MSILKKISQNLSALLSQDTKTNVVEYRRSLLREELTPTKISQALLAFLAGSPGLAEPLFNKMVLDEHLDGCMTSRLSATSGLNLDFHSQDEGTEIDTQRDFLKMVFENLQVDDLIEEILEARYRTFKVIEPKWDIEESRFVLKGFTGHPNDLFLFNRDDIFINANGKKQEFAKDNDWYYAVKVRSKKSILLRCLRPYMIKTFGYDSWVHFIEVFSDPFRIGRYPDGAGEDIRNQMWEAVRGIGQDGAAAMPMSAKMEFVENSRTGDQTFGGLVAACEAGLSKAVLGHSAGIDATPGKLGQDLNALNVRKDLAMADRRFAVRWLYAGFIKPLLIFNFPKPAPLRPILTENVVLSREEVRTAMKLMWDMGGDVDPEQFKEMGVIVQDNAPLLKRGAGDLVF